MAVLRDTIARVRDRLVAAGVDTEEAALDAELLTRHALGWDRATLVARLRDEPPPALDSALAPLAERRLRREPMAYILGVQEFWGRDFMVGRGVLIPRPETELIVEEALAWTASAHGTDPLTVLDVGTGSGCLAATLALELPQAIVHATDISPDALAIARENADRLGATVTFHRASLLGGLSGLSLIVANPPYVARSDYEGLQPEVRLYEPETALVGGDDGLDLVRALVSAAADGLVRGGRLLVEIGAGQADAVGRFVSEVEELNLSHVRDDLQGVPRVVVVDRR